LYKENDVAEAAAAKKKKSMKNDGTRGWDSFSERS
jgi:hypothetical protein